MKKKQQQPSAIVKISKTEPLPESIVSKIILHFAVGYPLKCHRSHT